ncbi:tryptophan--tRNA ligase [bacterium BMS3Abin15]|nr:tryptophan--tRNA ligase [bacterium BMS3Abin15]HDH07411.1 tryptophan--tRNA ligase [Candidatus Moranbacteria bacterium]HDZ85539.1 tryptophan--tRNA ligase [Candidatus Moranbacteria bacterium]
MNKKIFSGVQPSGNLHIGNYLGAIKNWVELQDKYDSVFCVVDLHAITTPQDPEELRKKTIEVAKIYLAAGIDPEKCAIFIQSHIPEHTELTWILNTIIRMSDLSRMTQFKDKSRAISAKAVHKNSKGEIIEEKVMTGELLGGRTNKNINVGLFDYPALMAADILLYDTEVVPVGEDQLQHIELTRVLAKRFNQKFGETFKIPEAGVVKEGMRIMGLDDPTKKMSKSATSEYNYIGLTDDADTVRNKIKKAVTDSGSEIKYTDDKPALKNLINIYSLLDDKKPEEVVEKYKGKGYADFKNDLAEVIIKFLEPFQEKFNSLSDDEVLGILKKGAEKVRPMAEAKMKEVKEKMGLI